MYPSESVKYIQLFAFLTLLNIMEKALVHIDGDVTSRTLPFICNKRGWTKARKGRELHLVSFGGQIDRETVTRMSGRHRMISLINEGPCPVLWG